VQILVTIAKSKEQNTVKAAATKPVSVTYNGDVKKPNDVTDRRNGHRNCCRLTLIMLSFLCSLLIYYGCAPTHWIRPKTDINHIKKIAVLPFENFTQDDYAGEKIRRIVITELLSRDVDVIEPGEVTRLFREMKIKSLGSVKVSEIQEIGKALNVEVVILGSVEAFGTGRGISVNYSEVTIDLRMLEVNSGNIVWSVRNASGGPDFRMRHFGSEGASLSEAAEKVVKKAIGTLY